MAHDESSSGGLVSAEDMKLAEEKVSNGAGNASLALVPAT
jgi:hypothetical protein